jgi:hypothetical protein
MDIHSHHERGDSMHNIFVSYRREDSSDVTGRIFDHLKARFGKEHLFKDVDSIALGVDFREAMIKAVQDCDVFLAVIGADWLNARDEAGGRRIDKPEDYVQLEVKAALDRNIPVIPVLVERASMPTQQDLPEPLQPLALRNAISVRPDPDFRHDMDRLSESIERFLKPEPVWLRILRGHWRSLAAAVGVLILAAFIVIIARREPPIPPDVISKLTVINVTIIVKEYEKMEDKPLDEKLKQQIDLAVASALDGKHLESVRLLEEIATKAPLPSIYTNLGVEYAKLNKVAQAKSAFAKAIDKDPGYQAARANQRLLDAVLPDSHEQAKPIAYEPSSIPTMLLEPLDAKAGGMKEIQVVKPGALARYYQIEYTLKPGVPVIVNPGKYDLIFKPAGDGNFIIQKDLGIASGQLVRINPNLLLGTLLIEPIERKDLPAVKQVQLFQTGEADERLIYQQADKLGVPMAIVPGRYDIRIETADGDEFIPFKNVAVKERQIVSFQFDKEVAGFIVHKPAIPGIQVDAIRVRRSGREVARTKKFDRPILVPPGDGYEIVLDQPSGQFTVAPNVTAKRGELITVP